MTRDPKEGLDSHGRIVTGVDPDAIGPPYDEIVSAVVDHVADMVGDGLHGLYLYGSVATGQAVPPTSDVDLYAAVTCPVDKALSRRIKRIEWTYTDHIRGIGLSCVSLDDIQAADGPGRSERCFIRHYCLHVAGQDLRDDITPCVADAQLARGFNGDLAALVDRVTEGCRTTDEQERRRAIAHGSRRVLMGATTLLSLRHGTWSTDCGHGASLLASSMPDLADDARRLSRWADLTTGSAPGTDEAIGAMSRVAAYVSEL